MVAPYNLPQTVFMLSEASNYLFDQKSPVPGKLQSEIEAFLAPGGPFYAKFNSPLANWPSLAGGDWSTVWGPVVYQADLNFGATNVMYVAYSKNLQTYVVAIAGTNPTGWFALTNEDLKVGPSQMVLWPPHPGLLDRKKLTWDAPKANAPIQSQCCIDKGTSDGIDALYHMRDGKTGQSLSDFLNGLGKSQSGNTLIFTGHSLGGALSPTLAMLLYPDAEATTGASAPALNSQWKKVYILATAGPSPGTAEFASLFASPLPPQAVPASTAPVPVTTPPVLPPQNGPYAPVLNNASTSAAMCQMPYWNVVYANVYDVVPRAWNGLAMLVQKSGDNYPSFFANGSMLGGTDGLSAGPVLYGSINHLMNLAGYNGDTTPYYAPCLTHYPFNGAMNREWGEWEPKSTTYPATWQIFESVVGASSGSSASASDGTSKIILQPPLALASVPDVMPYVLNAHLDQYSFALLGYPSPSFDEFSSAAQ